MTVCDVGTYCYEDTVLARDAAGQFFGGTHKATGARVLLKEMKLMQQREENPAHLLPPLSDVPHVAFATDQVWVGQKRFLITGRADGELLSTRLVTLREDGLRGRHALLCILADVCEAVDELHRGGLVHGNIHPGTILVQAGDPPHGNLLTLDPFSAPLMARHIASNDFLQFVSPEQLRGRGGRAADIYALGMLLHVVFGSGPPYQSSSAYELAEQIIWGNIEPFEPYVQDLDENLAIALKPDLEAIGVIIARALQRNPRARYSTAGEIRTTLWQIAQHVSPIALGRTLYRSGRSDLAAAVLEQITSGPNAAEACVMLGQIYSRAQDGYEKATVALKRALKHQPGLVSARQGLADLYRRHGRLALAKREFMEMLQAQPNDTEALLGYAGVLQQAGDLDAAQNVLRRIEELNPFFLRAYISAIRLALGRKDIPAAEATCQRAMDRVVKVVARGNLDRDQVAELYYLRGLLHKEQGRPDRAIAWCEKALDQAPHHVESHLLLAQEYGDAGDPERALEHFLASIGPDQGNIMEIIAQFLQSNAQTT